MLENLPSTMALPRVDPTAFKALHWYDPASCSLTSLMRRYGLSILPPAYFPLLPEISMASLFLNHRISVTRGDKSLRKISVMSFSDPFWMLVSWLFEMFGEPKTGYQETKLIYKNTIYHKLIISKIHTTGHIQKDHITETFPNFIPYK